MFHRFKRNFGSDGNKEDSVSDTNQFRGLCKRGEIVR